MPNLSLHQMTIKFGTYKIIKLDGLGWRIFLNLGTFLEIVIKSQCKNLKYLAKNFWIIYSINLNYKQNASTNAIINLYLCTVCKFEILNRVYLHRMYKYMYLQGQYQKNCQKSVLPCNFLGFQDMYSNYLFQMILKNFQFKIQEFNRILLILHEVML